MNEPTPRPKPRWILPVVAGVASLAVGVTSYLVAAPFGTPRVVPPETVIVDQLTLGDDFTPLVDVAAAGEPQLVSASVPRSDPEADAAATLSAAMDAIDAAVRGEAPTEPEPEWASGITVLDPCLGAASPDEPCPDGARATVLASVSPPALEIWAGPALTDDCPIEPTATSVGFRLVTTVPVSGTVRYIGDDRWQRESFATSDGARNDWFAAGEEDGDWPTLTQCLTLTGLPAGWSGRLYFTADADDGSVAMDTLDLSTAGIVAPPSFVRPLTRTSLMVSVPSEEFDITQFHAIAVPFGERAPSCDFGEDADTLSPTTTVTETVTPEQLEASGYLVNYPVREAAFFVVPEASTITVCAGVGGARGGSVPDTIFSEVVYSPDLALPVVSVVGFEAAPGVEAIDVTLTAQTDLSAPDCGSWQLFDASGIILCDYRQLDGDFVDWDAPLTLTARGFALGSTAERVFVVPVSPQECGLGCELPRTQFVDAPVSFREPCTGDGCDPTFLGTVRLRVDWEHGTRSWQRDWLSEDAPPPSPETPILETQTTPSPTSEVGADGEQFASVRLETLAPATAVVEAYRLDEFLAPELVATWSSTGLDTRHLASLGPFEGGGIYYGLLVRLTDAEGDTSVYSWRGGEERSWTRGVFITSRTQVSMNAEVTVQAVDGTAIAVGVAELSVGGSRAWQRSGTGIDDVVCGSGPVAVPFDSDTADIAGTSRTTRIWLSVQVSPLGENGVDATGCTWRGGGRPPAEAFIAEIPYRDILDGVTATMRTESGYTAVVRFTPAP